MFGFKRRRRRKLRDRPFPAEWLEVLRRNLPYYRLLCPSEQAELQGHIQVFLAEKGFEGCGGLVMTDEIRVSIAAQACILLLGREGGYYPRMKSIFVYPHGYEVPVTRRGGPDLVVGGEQGRLGESWYRGPVVLSWDDVRKGAADVHDGQNLIFHEFAHQLDSETGSHDGAPLLSRRSMYIAWARVLGAEYRRLTEDLRRHRDTVLDGYGATDPAEFFAVATEAFFEKPIALRRRHRQLYQQLAEFYRQDPAARDEQAPAGEDDQP
ncbi:hypothetical protein LCGC14_2471600 [marine sediment metagenome]|uniref:Protein MtfA n=1 Tax=marine sediment metagenome TaxID=412755 RepID=A0A0F9DMB4_9ZZZZ